MLLQMMWKEPILAVGVNFVASASHEDVVALNTRWFQVADARPANFFGVFPRGGLSVVSPERTPTELIAYWSALDDVVELSDVAERRALALELARDPAELQPRVPRPWREAISALTEADVGYWLIAEPAPTTGLYAVVYAPADDPVQSAMNEAGLLRLDAQTCGIELSRTTGKCCSTPVDLVNSIATAHAQLEPFLVDPDWDDPELDWSAARPAFALHLEELKMP